MGKSGPAFVLRLLGSFRLEAPAGERVDISSKRGQALLAMLATAGSGERTRTWLQDRLWGSRGPDQAQASLRRELSNLRKIIGAAGSDLVQADYNRVWLNLASVEVDLRDLDGDPAGEFLEGLDIAGEDGFEDWLREERRRIAERRAATPAKPQTTAPSAPALAEFALRPAIAVLPFVWLPANPEREAIAQGLSEDLTDRLAKLRWLPVIARSSSFAAVGDARAVGLQLGARYVVEGSIRSDDTRSVLAASLTDTESGQVLWSDRIVMPLGGGTAELDQLPATIAAILGLKIDLREQARAMARPASDLKVSDLIWRGRWHLNRLTKADSAAARECFDQALALEPGSPEALIQATWVRLWALWVTRGGDEDVRAVRQMAQQAIIADYDDARGHMLAGIAEIWLRQPLRAEALLARAIELNPSLVMAHAQLGCALHLKGEHAAAIERLRFAVRLSPNDHDLFFTLGELAGAHLFSGEAATALDHAEQALARRSAYWLAHVIKIKALVELGRPTEAKLALTDLAEAKTGFREEFIDWMPFLDGSKRQVLKDGLNRAAV
jgi:TolB-like protein